VGGVGLHFVSPQLDTGLHCKTTDTGLVLVHYAVCLFTRQLSLVLNAPIHRGMARLSYTGWLVISRSSVSTCRHYYIFWQ